MAKSEIHQNDIGTTFRVTILDGTTIVDLSTATSKQLIFQKPDNTNLIKTASLYTDGTDGIIQYTTVAGDLDIVGVWSIEAFIVFGTNQWHSDVSQFRVFRNLN
jgi:hypothetical protein